MSKAYKFTLTFITLLIIASIILGVTYLFYDKEVSESTIVLVDGNLSINFLDGNVIKNKEEKTFDMRFSVTNNSDEEASYKINIEDVKNKSENIYGNHITGYMSPNGVTYRGNAFRAALFCPWHPSCASSFAGLVRTGGSGCSHPGLWCPNRRQYACGGWH